MVAARKGQLGVMQLLIAARANLALADEQGSTALHYAVLGNQTAAATLLLDNHAPIDVKDGFDLTPLMLATRFGDLALVQTMIKHNANLLITDQNGWSAIFFAAARGDSYIFDAIADRVDENKLQDNEGDTLIHVAIANKQKTILKKLLELHVPANVQNKKKITPVRLAIEEGDVDALKILSDVVSVSEKLADGRTPLMLAIDLRQKDVAAYLFAGKADLAAKDPAGKTYSDHLTALGLDNEWLEGRASTQ
jgi:ankyrin repeat protein